MAPIVSGPDEAATDLAVLWERTVNEYIKRTGEDISRLQGKSMSEIKMKAENDNESFVHFRHYGDKTDKVRTAFGNHLDNMQRCVDGIAVLGNAASAFPPALPVTIVFSACSFLLRVSLSFLYAYVVSHTDSPK